MALEIKGEVTQKTTGSYKDANENGTGMPHRFTASDRTKMALTGVSKVISFEELEAIVETSVGKLTIKGNNMHIKRFDVSNGELDFEGRLECVCYTDSKHKQKTENGIVKRLFS